ncbi:MAG TPA: hypothetical protein P5572_08420 [Phycisphaerae bacterium]|nr:hypothetical protein [Phycisphaerae bacterium]
MARKSYSPADLKKIRTYSVSARAHKVHLPQVARLPEAGASAADLLAAMPDFLGVRELRAVVDKVAAAHRADRPVVMAMGAHVVKVGCAPIVIDLMRRGIVRALVFNGATAIHDAELATLGATSEEVADTIRDGTFGMVAETMELFTAVCALAESEALGLGAAAGRLLVERSAPHAELSMLAMAHRFGVPVTVHVALGTDTIHMADGVDGARLGAASIRDFKLLCSIVADLGATPADGAGGVWLNIGSAVVLPEVFLKAVSVARNLGASLDAMVTANFDMQRHYRPKLNVVTRPVKAGNGHEVIGHHEILLPLLRQAIIEKLA